MLEARTASWTDVRDRAASGPLAAVVAFGALEAHGAHLPLATDTIVAERVARALAEHADALLLPAIAYGDTFGTAGYPGTVSLSPDTVRAVAVDLARSVTSFGVRGLIVVNGDFGNRVPLASAARILAPEGIRMLVLDYPGLDAAISEVRESTPAAPGLNHAEEIETSMVLAAEPAAVRMERAEPDYPAFPPDFGQRPMPVHEFSASAVFGDPTVATVEKGERLFAATIAAAIVEVDRFLAG